MIKRIFLSLLFLSFSLAAVAAIALEGDQEARGATLYKKHCSGCHTSAGRIKPGVNIFDYTRKPFAAMPAFPPERISDADLHILSDYIKLQIYYSSQQ